MKTGYIVVPVKIKYDEVDDERIQVHGIEMPASEDCERAYEHYSQCIYRTKDEGFRDINEGRYETDPKVVR